MADDKYLRNRQKVYDLLKGEGYSDDELGGSAEALFKDRDNASLAFQALSNAGYSSLAKDEDDFVSKLYAPEAETQSVTAPAPVRSESQRRTDRFNEMVRQREAAKGRTIGEETPEQEAAGKAEVEKRMASQAERIARTQKPVEQKPDYTGYDYKSLEEEYAKKKEEYAPLISEYEAKMNVNLSSPEDFVTSSWLGEHNSEYNKAVGDLMAIGSEMASRPEYKSQESAIMEQTDASDETIKAMRKDGKSLNGELMAARLMNKKTRQLASQPYSDGGKKDALGYLGSAIWDYGKGTLDRVKTAEWLSRGLTNFVEGVNLRPLQEKLQKMEAELKPYEGTEDYDYMAQSLADDRLTEEDKVLLASYLNYGRMMELRENNVPLEYRGGQMFADTAGYMIDFLLTRKVDAVGRNAMGKALGKWAPATLFGKGVKAGALELGGAFTRTLSMVPQTLGQIGDSMTEMENVYDDNGNVVGAKLKRSVAESVADGLVKEFIEVASEGSGEIMQKAVGTAISRYFKRSAIPKTIIGRETREFLRGAGGLIRRGQIQGLPYEDLEEILGGTANTALGKLTGGKIGDEDALKQTLSKEAQQEMLIGFLPFTAVTTLGSLKAANRMQANYDESMRKWEGLVQAGAGVTEEDLNNVVDGLENKSTEDLMKSVANINNKIRKSGVDMPETEVRDMMNKIIAGRLAYDLQGELWENSEDRMAIANAYAGAYGMPIENNLYDITQTVGTAEAAAKEQGFTDEELGRDASVLMLEAEGMEERGGRDAERAETLKAYAMAKAQQQAITDGYQKETADMLRAFEEPIINLADNNGSLVVAQTADGQEVYVASKDAIVGADGNVSAPTGPDGLISILYGNGTTATVKANTLAGAQQVDTETYLMDKEYEFNEERAAEFQQAQDTISASGMAQAVGELTGQTVFVNGNGAYEPVRVERMTHGGEYTVISGDKEALKGIASALGIQSPGGSMLEAPTTGLYEILAKDDDGSISTDMQAATQETAPQEAPAETEENSPESLIDTRQTITYKGQPLEVTVLDVSDGKVIFEDGDGLTDSIPVNEFYSRMQAQEAPVEEPAPAPAPEPAPAEPAVPESGIPIDEESGEPIYDAEGVTPEQAYNDIYGRFGEDTSDADSFVVEQSTAADKAYKKAQKASDKAESEKAEIDKWKRNPGEGLNAFAKRKADAKAEVDSKAAKSTENLPELQRKADFWGELREVADANIAEAKAEAERQKLIEQYGVDTSGFDLTPQTMEEALADGLAGFFRGGGRLSLGSVLDLVGWNMLKDLRKGGYGFVLSRKQEALPVDKFVMDVADEYPGLIKDEQDAINKVGELLTGHTRGELGQFVFNARLEEARKQAENEEAPVEEPIIEEAQVVADEAPVEEAPVEEQPTTTEETPEETPVEEPETPAEEAPVEEPAPAPETEVEQPVQEVENKPEKPSESPEISVTSQEGEKGGESTYGSSNKVISKERYEELRKKMLAKIKGQANAGFDPEIFAMGVEMAAYHIEAGARKFVDFAKRMIADLTDAIRPYLKGIYNGARDLPGMEEYKKEMTPASEVENIDINADFNNLSDEQDDNADIQPGEGGVSEPVADTDGGGSEEEPGGDIDEPESGTPAEDGGEGGNEVGDVDGGNGGEPTPGTRRAAADGTPGRRGRRGSKSDDGGGAGRGTRRNRGSRQGESGGNEGAGLHTDVGESEGHGNVETEEQKEAKAKAAEQAAYEAEKEAVKEDKDTKALKDRKDKIKEQLLGITDKYDLNRAKLAGQLRAILERLQYLFSHNLNKSEALAQEKVPYVSVADPTGKYAIGSVVPSGAADYMRDAVKRLEAEVKKPVAQYVQEELGYASLEEMYTDLPEGKFDGLSSEQVDAVGLAIHQMKTGRVFIVGDMTGVGKGRVGAALIRWGLRNKKKVLFCTEKPGLFSAMYGDIENIGGLGREKTETGKGKKNAVDDNMPIPFIINNDAGANITDEDNVVQVPHPSSNEYDEVFKSGKDTLPVVARGKNKGRQYDFVMTTYSQLQATEEEEEGDSEKVKKKNERNTKGRQRLNWLKNYAKDAIIVMDESHTATGEGSTRSENAKKLVEVAKGVTFMSATFAKTPESMGLYAIRSSMNDAMITRDQLIAAISKYGIPMQEILAASLFKTGEMVRRERDFDGVKTNWLAPEESYSKEEIETTRALSDKTVSVINAIIDFQRRYVDPAIRKMNEALKVKNDAALASGAEDVYVYEYASTPYSGQVSNVVGMMLFALKAKKAAEIAIEQIKRGEKPVIAVDNTLGAYVDQIEGNIDSADFGAVLMKGLAFALRYQLTTKHKKLVELPNGARVYKDVPGDKKVDKYDSILDRLGAGGEDAVEELEKKIIDYGKETLALDLPLSPIDYIEKKIEDAGYRCGEITQRANALVQNADGTWTKKPITHKKPKEVVRMFNGGMAKKPLPKEETYDAVIMNRSGATGNSMHSYAKFADQRPRKMIILQAAKDPNNEVQIRGRIDRTGQVSRGEYFYVISPIPAEKKITMMLKQKLASLDANSVGSEKVSSNKVDAEDMDNKYGDEVAHDFLVDHEEIHFQMDPSKQMKRNRKTGEYVGRPGLLYDLLLNMQRMTCAEQELILNELEEAYTQKIEYLNQNGINDLATTTMNLEATTVDSAIMVKGKDNESLSEFAHDTNIERVEVNVLRKPLRSEDIWKKVKELGGLEKHTRKTVWGEDEDQSYGEYVQQRAREAVDAMQAEKKQKLDAALAKLREDVKADTPKPDTMTDEQYEAAIDNDPRISSMTLKNMNEYARYEAQTQEQLRFLRQATDFFRPGRAYLIPLNESEGAQNMYGRFLGYKVGKDAKPKSIEAMFATKDSRAMVSIPIVNMHKVIDTIRNNSGGWYDLFGKSDGDYGSEENRLAEYDKWWDKMIPENTSRAIRYMITGNILQSAGSLAAYRGTITTFTRKDAETGEITIDKGLLLAEDFDPENFMVRTEVTKDDVWNTPGEFKDDLTNISAHREGDQLVVKFTRPRGSKTKLANHPVMSDDEFKALCEGGEIIPYGQDELRAVISEKNAEAALDYLYKNYGFTQGHLLVLPDSTDKPDRIVYSGKPYKEVIDELKPKYRVYGADGAQSKIDDELKTYKMDITNEDIKNRIRELVQLRQAYLRRDNSNVDNADLAWNVIIAEENAEKFAKPDPTGETPEEAIERKKKMTYYRNLAEAFKEELESRGFEKGHLKHFKQGQTDLDTIIETFNEFNSDKKNAEIAKKVFAIQRLLNVNFFFNEKLNGQTGGNTAGDYLGYNWKFMNEDWIPDQLKANTILHEMIHTATSYAVNAVNNGSDHLIPGLADAANQANALFSAISRNKAFRHQTGESSWDFYTDYGAKYNAKEMLCEAGSNQQFRDDLKKVKVLVQQQTSFGQTTFSFTDVTDNDSVSGNVMTALDAVMDILNRMIDGFNPDGYRKMWAGSGYGQISYRKQGEEDNGLRFRFIGEKGAARADTISPIARRMETVEVPRRGLAKLFGSEKFKTIETAVTRVDNLNIAKKMQAEGVRPEDIKRATGWEVGRDGKWRYEESDVSINEDFLQNIQGKSLDERSRETYPLGQILKDGPEKDMLFAEYPELSEIEVSFYNDSWFDFYNLTRGYYNPVTKKLMLNPKGAGWLFTKKPDAKELSSTMVHELQHVIQHIEGFAQGGNTSVVDKYGNISGLKSRQESIAKRIEEIVNSDDKYRELNERYERMRDEYSEEYKEHKKKYDDAVAKFNAEDEEYKKRWNETEDRIAEVRKAQLEKRMSSEEAVKEIQKQTEIRWELLKNKPRYPVYDFFGGRIKQYTADDLAPILREAEARKNEIIDNSEEIKRLKKEGESLKEEISNEQYRLYQSISGEVEARNVQKRMDMTDEERRNSIAESTEDVQRTEQILLEDDNAKESLNQSAERSPQRRVVDAEIEATYKTLERMSDALGVKINKVSRSGMPTGHKSDKGYFDPKTGEMTICMDNVTDERDAIATVLHETVGHKGLRELFGPRFREAMTNIYASLDRKGRAWVNGYIARHGLGFGEEGIVHGMEEYMAHLAETGDFKNTVWDRIKEIIGKVVDLVFGTDGFVFTDRELNYILRASYEHLKNPNWLNTPLGKAKNTLWKRELGINETDPNKPTDPDGPGTGLRFRDGDTGLANEDYNDEMDLWHNKMIIENQNADLPVKIGMDKVMKETGKKEIREDEDYLRRHNVASSRAESEAHNFELFHFTPLLETVRAIQSKLISGKNTKDARQKAYERILDYIYAVSGLERNEYKNNEIEQQKQEALAILNDPETASARIAAEMKAHPEKYNTPSEIKALADKIDKRIEKEKEKAISRYDSMKRDWAGITDLTHNDRKNWVKANSDAQAIVDAFKASVGDNALLDELWDRIRSCTDFSLEHAYKYGLLTREEFERLHGTDTQPRMWDYYVPLRGFNEETAEEVFDYSSFLSPSNDSAVVKKMKGRWTKADNPLANILNIAESEIVQGNDNWAKQALYRFTLDAGENTLLTQVEPWYVKNPATGTWTLAEPDENESLEKFEERMRGLADLDTPLAKKGRRGLKLDKIMANKAHRNEHMIRLKVRGVEKMIWVNGNPALAKAVTGIGRAQNMQWLRRASRVLSNLFTTFSLDFSVKNLIRDTIYSRTALLVKEDKKYRRTFAKNWRKNFGYGAFAYPMVKLAAAWDSGKLQSKPENERTEKEQMFIDFMTDGGQTGYTIINSVNEIKKSLERSMRQSGKKVKEATIPIFGVRIPLLDDYAKAVKTLNEGFELLTRFTAYETSREVGRSGLRSASDAKEISVNFNRRGAQSGNGIWGNIAAYLGATHYFYNAGVQGFENFLRLFKTSPKKMGIATGSIFALGILTPLINSMFAAAGDGDDDWYWNLPEWVRRNNLVLGWPEKEKVDENGNVKRKKGAFYFAVPLPVEFRAIYGLGDIASAAFCYQLYGKLTGKDKHGMYPNRTFGRLVGDMISTASGILPVNPVEGYTGSGNIGDAIIRAVAPDAGMFFVDWATNRDYTGRPLWKENPFSDTVPKSQGAYASTPKDIVFMCQKLAQLSAGNIDLPPGLVRDFFNNYMGGFFRVGEDLSKLGTGIFGNDPDRPFRYDNLPFLSGFTGHIDEDRSNTFATNALREYKDISEGIVKKANAICGTNEITAAMVYGDKEIPEQYASKVRLQRILSGKDYEIGKEYRDGMNNKYKMKQYVRGDKIGQWYKSKEVEEYGVNALKQTWKELREEWAAMPHKTEEEKSARSEKFLEVQDAWHKYYDAEGDLAEKLMKIEYGKK